MAVTDRCCLSNKVLNAIFLQTAPGYEEDTIQEIRSNFGEEINVFRCFGRYDLLLIDEKPDFSLLLDFQKKGLSHIWDWFPVLGLRWSVSGKKIVDLSNKKSILGLCFIKLDLDYILSKSFNPISIEEKIIKEIRSNLPCIIYSSLGFNELLVIIQAENFKELTNSVIEIKRRLIDQKTLIALDLSTVPAINYAASVNNKVTSELQESIETYHLLSVRVGLNHSFKQKLKDIVGDTGITTFGFHDVLLKISGDVYDVMDKILRIRKEGAKHGLHSTLTIIPHFDEPLDFNVFETSELNYELKSIEGEISNSDEDEEFRFFKRWAQTCARDPLTRHSFKANTEFFSSHETLDDLSTVELPLEMKGRIIDAQKLDILRECIRVGFEQRSSDLGPGNSLGQKSIRTESLGSIQRAIIALESLPFYLCKELGFGNWPRLCIYGYSGRFYRIEGSIINIPRKYRIFPEMWWGIFHETGHEIFSYIEDPLKYRLMAELEAIVKTVTKKYKKITEQEIEFLNYELVSFIEEVFAEIFGFHYGFNDNWRLYLNKVWSYFAKELELDFKHISRSVLVYFAFGPGKDLDFDEVTLEKIDSCIREIERITKKQKGLTIENEEWDNAIALVWDFLNVADIIRSYFLEKPTFIDNKNVQKVRRALKKGQLVDYGNPVEIMFSLMTTQGKHQCNQRFATILSLYGSYWKNVMSGLEE